MFVKGKGRWASNACFKVVNILHRLCFLDISSYAPYEIVWVCNDYFSLKNK